MADPTPDGKYGYRTRTASYELSRELYELSGWDHSSLEHFNMEWDDQLEKHVASAPIIPAYDLSYLLGTLEAAYPGVPIELFVGGTDTKGNIKHGSHVIFEPNSTSGDTPEDAVATLAIELFRQGILIKEAGVYDEEL